MKNDYFFQNETTKNYWEEWPLFNAFITSDLIEVSWIFISALRPIKSDLTLGVAPGKLHHPPERGWEWKGQAVLYEDKNYFNLRALLAEGLGWLHWNNCCDSPLSVWYILILREELHIVTNMGAVSYGHFPMYWKQTLSYVFI